jgi:hypothetical protein
MEILGIERTFGIVMAVLLNLSLITFGFNIYFKGKHFWGTYYLIALIGTMTVAIFLLIMHWVSINQETSERLYAAFLCMVFFIAVTMILALIYHLFEIFVKKKSYTQVYDIGTMIDKIDSRILVFDKLGLRTHEFGNLKDVDLKGVNFEKIQDFYQWERNYAIETDRIIKYESSFLMVKKSFITDRSHHQIGQIIMISDVTQLQKIINKLDAANTELELANFDFYQSIDLEIQLKKEQKKYQMIAETNNILLDRIGAVIESMDSVLDSTDATLEDYHTAVISICKAIDNIYIELREVINYLSLSEENEVI